MFFKNLLMKKNHFYCIEIFIHLYIFYQIKNWAFSSFWVVLHVKIETIDYGIKIEN
jgi:hypothetical protein